MPGEGVEGGGDAGPAFGQRDVPPGAVLVERGAHGLPGGDPVQAGRARDGAPSTGLVAGSARPSGCQAEFQRLRTRSSRKASGATVRQRCQASVQEVPDLRVRVGGMRLAPLSVHGREKTVGRKGT
ncbi:hypothetical protein SHKM778_35320 [Streptomyces sp. KM77-8]|uniref:Uncharacterized protein n=1 Tax=Streptomyces haneummycinicus TaxID=3074435 RepID=A0AAT9HIL4_9ACTN